MGLKNSEGLRKGFTTGSCAQAAAKGAAIMFLTQKQVGGVAITTPSGIKLNLGLVDQEVNKTFASCAVIKDSGDDPDVTNGARIYAQVKFFPKREIIIKGGDGVGIITKPGLAVGVGEYAINPTPRKMILKELTDLLPKDKGFEVTISVPGGKALADKTFNPRLGVVGGISIIGTTGIVEPRSLDAYKTSLALQLDVFKAAGRARAIFVLGYVGEKFCKDVLKIQDDAIIKIGDHAGFMLEQCARKEIKEVVLAGHIGKLIKIANGQFNTHFQFGDGRMESIANFARLSGASGKINEKILEQKTAEATVGILKENHMMEAYNLIAHRAAQKLENLVENKVKVSCIILNLEGDILGEHPKNSMDILKEDQK